MEAFMYPSTARSLLAQSREFTAAKRAQREQAKQIESAFSQLVALKFSPEQAKPMARFYVTGSWE